MWHESLKLYGVGLLFRSVWSVGQGLAQRSDPGSGVVQRCGALFLAGVPHSSSVGH